MRTKYNNGRVGWIIVAVCLILLALITWYISTPVGKYDQNSDFKLTITDYTLHRIEYLQESKEIRTYLYDQY